jgi:tryptophan-rich sensory protein
MSAARRVHTPDDVRGPGGEESTPLPLADNPAPASEHPRAPTSSGSDPRRRDNGRWLDIAKLLMFMWAAFSSLAIGTSLSVIPYADPSVGGPSWAIYTAVAALAPWAVVFLVWRWPTVGAFALLAGFALWLVFASQHPQLSYWAFVLLCPALLTLPPAAAIALHLAGRRAARPGRGRQPPPSPHN